MKNKINVNMTPNPLDLQTLHCSQGDTSGRKFQFTLHNQGEVYDLSNISDPVFTSFPVEVGGTEELQPVNGTSPSTSPIIADITYPDGLREGEEFTYRESPTTISGEANFKAVYGNTLVWNQLLNVNTASNFISFDNGIINLNGTPTGGIRLMSNSIAHQSGHKYLFLENTIANPNNVTFTIGMGSGSPWLSTAGTIGIHNEIYTNTYNTYLSLFEIANKTLDGIKFSCQIFDLTQMFGAGNEPSTVDEFTSLFPLSYYPYDSGSLLSFNGTGIKVTGFNQWDEEWESGAYNQQTGAKMSASNIWRCTNYISVIPNETYYFKVPITSRIFWYDGNYNFLGTDTVLNGTKTVPSSAMFLTFHVGQASYSNDVCINFSSSRNGEYEPYTESTTSLPISTYFPTGMKSAGGVYDELTPTKAITRIGAVDLGTLAWYKGDNAEGIFLTAGISDMKYASVSTERVNGILCTKYLPSSVVSVDSNMDDKSMLKTTDRFAIRDTSYTDATTFKSAMSGVYLYYELATPTETSFTTASLVTENAEIPLSNEDGVLIGKCTEELSAEPGFHDAKIKLTDSDGDVYSNKIQLHVERRP